MQRGGGIHRAARLWLSQAMESLSGRCVLVYTINFPYRFAILTLVWLVTRMLDLGLERHGLDPRHTLG